MLNNIPSIKLILIVYTYFGDNLKGRMVFEHCYMYARASAIGQGMYVD